MFCDKAKEFLSQQGIWFTERDLMVDYLAIAELEVLGHISTPDTVTGGELII
jgi:hypothetical protein